jgi:hypothetical protein
MPQSWIKAAFYRGGTSKGVFFHARDLPQARAQLDSVLVAVLGSPDPYGRQLDGMGGGISSLSKAVIIAPPTHEKADVDYTFVRLAVNQAVADWSSNCGNLASAVGPFSVDEGLVRVADGEALVSIHQTNTRKLIHARFPVADGRAVTEGDYAIAGVAGTGARVRLDFCDPAGAVTGKLLPTGSVLDRVEIGGGRAFEVSIVDAATLVVYVRARDLGLEGTEPPDVIDAQREVMAALDQIRRAAGVRIGLASAPERIGLQTPRIALVSAPAPYRSLDGQRFEAALSRDKNKHVAQAPLPLGPSACAVMDGRTRRQR